MDRTVPKTGGEEIELYMRTYYSLLRSTHPIQILALVESHMGMASSLHVGARDPGPDVSALIYTSLRLPPCILQTDLLVLGQSEEVFASAGYGDVLTWQRVNASGRRRRMHFDGNNVLAVFIASRSDIDDLMPTLTTYQIEWNKLHSLLQGEVIEQLIVRRRNGAEPLTGDDLRVVAEALGLAEEDVRRLQTVWGPDFVPTLAAMAAAPKHMSLQLLSGSLAHYRKATGRWWSNLERHSREQGVDLGLRPVYFVSSNTHALPNLLTGFAWRHEQDLLHYLHESRQERLLVEYEAICSRQETDHQSNFWYYVLKKYLQDGGGEITQQLADDERRIGISRVQSERGFDVEAQVVEVRRLHLDWLDRRVSSLDGIGLLTDSDAVLLNIDYPLGMAAYELLNEVARQVGALLGVYVMGKSASLNGRIGDVMIPNVVHDEHSQNTYLFGNCFAAGDVAPFLTCGTVLDNQKAISALGTFLQNPRYMDVFYREGYTIIEMEAGPYLSSIYEAVRPKRHPYNEIVNLYGTPFDIGFLHYASDTPMTKGQNLGSGSLSYSGIDPTYAAAVAILRRIFSQEVQRLRQSSANTGGLSPTIRRAVQEEGSRS